MTTNTPDTEALLKCFLTKLPSRSPQSIADRILYWSDVANNPQHFTDGDTSPHAIRAKRKLGIQSLKRLIARNPVVAANLSRERAAEGK